MLVALGLFALLGTALCEDNVVRLHNSSDFINFMNTVNSGKDYKRTTVFLENAIDLSGHQGQLNPIGISYTNQFSGIFDGQGYGISYFTINTTCKYAGLFGYSKGATIKNIIVGMTSVMNVFSAETDSTGIQLHAGGIIARCDRVGNPCIIENSVNIANVTYTGSKCNEAYLGGIAGYIYSRQDSLIKNCANYGMVANYGQSNVIKMGGIIGFLGGSSTKNLNVHNCLNLGPVVFTSGLSGSWFIGGIVGSSEYCTYDNCVSAGKIWTDAKGSGTIGSLSGESIYTLFVNCYWNRDVGSLTLGTETEECASYDSSFTLDQTITTGGYTGNKLLDALNTAVDHYVLYDYSHWGYSDGEYEINFIIGDRLKRFYLDSQLLLLPGLSSEGKLTFDGWYTDEGCTKLLSDFIFKEDLKIYGQWKENTNKYTITFDTRGGTSTPPPITGLYNTEVTLPSDVKKDNCELEWWENDYGDMVSWDYTIPAHDATLHAVWACTVIKTASDLVGLTKVINSGTRYKGTTVTLGNDIDFISELSEQFEPIGTDTNNNYFKGTFDGHGHVIRNLNIKTSPVRYGGLFGFSKGVAIRNLVVDSTCSVVSKYGAASGDEESFFGAFIGYCEANSGPCTIENSVNMAPVRFEGKSSSNIYIGGLVGRIYGGNSYEVALTNCVNYGSVTHAGVSNKNINFGGIAGGCSGGENEFFIRNCMNYGTVSYVGESKTECIGGIAGHSVDKVIYENCVSAGTVNVSKTSSYIGSIVGEIYSYSKFKNCYWDKSIGYEPTGYDDSTVMLVNSTSFDTEAFELTESVSIGSFTGNSLIKALNSYEGAPSKWALNKDSHSVFFKMNGKSMPFLTLNSQIILIPDITDPDSESFYGWFMNSNYESLFDSTEITSDITLYGIITTNFDDAKSNKANVAIVVSLVLIAIIIFIVIIFAAWKNIGSNYQNIKDVQELEEPILQEEYVSSINALDLYPEGYETPTLEKALAKSGIEEEKVEPITSVCYKYAENVMKTGTLPNGVSKDDAASIALYTMEAKSLKQNPYRMINEALTKGGPEAMEPVKDLLYLVMRALRKMPIVKNKLLYRGVRRGRPSEYEQNSGAPSDAEEDDGSYPSVFNRGLEYYEEDFVKGEVITWSSITSTSANFSAVNDFLAAKSAFGKPEGYLFIIEDGWGYNIKSCSMYPREEEIVLEPERRFKINSVSFDDGITIVEMKMLNTPLIFEGLFTEEEA